MWCLPLPPPPKKFEPAGAMDVFRARIKTTHGNYIGTHRTNALTFTDRGHVLEFEPVLGGFLISTFVILEDHESADPISKAYLHVDPECVVCFNVNPLIPPQVFTLEPIKKNFGIKMVELNKYLCAQGHSLTANRDKIGGWETFTLILHKEKEEIRAHPIDATFTMMSTYEAQLVARRHAKDKKKARGTIGVGADEITFTEENSIWRFEPNELRTAYFIQNVSINSYLSADSNGKLELSSNQVEWIVTGDWNSTASLRFVPNGKLLYADKTFLEASKEKKGEWEAFEIRRK